MRRQQLGLRSLDHAMQYISIHRGANYMKSDFPACYFDFFLSTTVAVAAEYSGYTVQRQFIIFNKGGGESMYTLLI